MIVWSIVLVIQFFRKFRYILFDFEELLMLLLNKLHSDQDAKHQLENYRYIYFFLIFMSQ